MVLLFAVFFLCLLGIMLLLVLRLAAGVNDRLSIGMLVLAAVAMALGIFFVVRIALPMFYIEDFLKKMKNGHLSEYDKLNKMYKSNYTKDKINMFLSEIKDATDREYTAQILRNQAELKALQGQINPHFLYNTLEAIRSKALLENVEDIAKMAKALATLFRYCISKHGDMVSLEDELNNLDNYLLIQKYRFNNKYEVQKIYEENEKLLSYRLPKMTIQPIVENAIMHGLQSKIGKGVIKINIIETETMLNIKISDNGVGIGEERLDFLNKTLQENEETSEESDPNNMGIALSNVNKRIKLCFGDIYGITVYSTLGLGTDVEIIIPKTAMKRDLRN
jgi:two-component system sensor histidine kinase YesM